MYIHEFRYFCICQNNLGMAGATPRDSEVSCLTNKCMDFCQHLISQGKVFSFTLYVNSSFSFSLDSKDNTIPSTGMVRKNNKSPSTGNKNAKRKAQFIKKKSELQWQSTLASNSSAKSLLEKNSVSYQSIVLYIYIKAQKNISPNRTIKIKF